MRIQNLSSSIKAITLIDIKGKVLQQVETASNSYSFNVNQLSAGIYFVKIVSDGKTTTLRFIKEWSHFDYYRKTPFTGIFPDRLLSNRFSNFTEK